MGCAVRQEVDPPSPCGWQDGCARDWSTLRKLWGDPVCKVFESLGDGVEILRADVNLADKPGETDGIAQGSQFVHDFVHFPPTREPPRAIICSKLRRGTGPRNRGSRYAE